MKTVKLKAGKDNQIRQGDVFLEKIGTGVPEGRVVKDGKRTVLEYGEVTGHAHAFSDEDSDVKLIERSIEGNVLERILAVGTDGGTLRHEEHTHIEFQPNTTYREIRQKEFSPFALRRVAD